MSGLSNATNKFSSTLRKLLRMEQEPKELSVEEFELLLEMRAQRSLGMSLPEFKAALKDGRLDPESSRVAGLAILVGERPG